MKPIIEILKTDQFLEWFGEQPEKIKLLIDSRFDRIAYYDHLGSTNRFSGIIELKWKSGMRIYTHRFDHETLIVLLGGTKHGQKKDINKAKKSSPRSVVRPKSAGYRVKVKTKVENRLPLTRHEVAGSRVQNIKLVKRTLIELLMNDDLESFQDVLVAHIRACPKSQLARETKLGRQTLYDLLDDHKEFNPTFKTLGAILQALPA